MAAIRTFVKMVYFTDEGEKKYAEPGDVVRDLHRRTQRNNFLVKQGLAETVSDDELAELDAQVVAVTQDKPADEQVSETGEPLEPAALPETVVAVVEPVVPVAVPAPDDLPEGVAVEPLVPAPTEGVN